MNNLKKVIVALLNTEDLTGYDIQKIIESSVANSHQQIYRDLNSLREDGYVKFEGVEQEGKPNKKVYSLIRYPTSAYVYEDSDFTKTNIAYMFAAINDKSNYHREYVEHMHKAEREFVALIERNLNKDTIGE